ncbi:hypothetical protein F2Q68_00008447 [Brassica cretica]|uniref:RNase H type-1 domain-containing protein n=1 Tax=Brassica cretica TaxID=69181 RepID=A0A3N6SQ34_BRACR|nr:hypothetical protein F2Q68_00008447 [Brassica cretica]
MILSVAKVLNRATNLAHFAHQSLATLKTKLAVVLTVTVPLSLIVYEPSGPVIPLKWKTPPWNMLKCNIGASWRNDLRTGGASWIILDSQGRVLSHSRRAYTGISSLWKQSSGPSYGLGVAHGLIVSLNSSRQGAYHMTCVHLSENKIANEISRSVTRYLRIQSYVAHASWRTILASIINCL